MPGFVASLSARIALLLLLTGLCAAPTLRAQPDGLHARIDERVQTLEEQVIAWRRHFHQHPELSNREHETAAFIAERLRALNIDVQTGVAHTGVVGVLEGGRSGPVVALRADMDALPIRERTDVPFASTATSTYRGEVVPVMHACGHDAHMAMLLGAATILSEMRDVLPGTVKFIFQPAEEGAPNGERGGARLMVEEGVLNDPDVDAIFGLHINAQTEVGTIHYRPGSIMAASDVLRITVHGSPAHGSTPWDSVDPIVTAAQIISGLQTVVSRQANLTKNAAVVSIGKIEGGVRNNIIPEQVRMLGTIRTLDEAMRNKVHTDIRRTATHIAESMGARATVKISRGYPVTYNDPDLTAAMLPTLERIAGADRVEVMDPITGAEDFSFFQREVPGLYVFIGGMPEGMNPEEASSHHTPDFYIDERGMQLGVRTLTGLAVDYMYDHAEAP